MKYLGINLKKLLKKESLSENELSKRIGIPQQMVNRIISGVNQNPKLSTITPIAEYFKIPLQELIYNANLDPNKDLTTNSEIRIPYLKFETLEQHDIADAILQATEFVSVNLDSNREYFATSMNDDSMEPRFSKGSILIFEQAREPLNGDFCLLKDEQNRYMFRQILINSENKQFIKCLNPVNEAYTMVQLPINIYVLATLLESRTLFSILNQI